MLVIQGHGIPGKIEIFHITHDTLATHNIISENQNIHFKRRIQTCISFLFARTNLSHLKRIVKR